MNDFDDRDELSRELSRELGHRSREVGGHPIDLAGVRRRARRIQWRRRAASGAVAAAVLAVMVPVGVSLTNGTSSSGPPVSTASGTASATASASTPSATPSASASTPSASPSTSPDTAPSASSSASSGASPGGNGDTPLVLADIPAGPAPTLPYLVTPADGSTTTIHHDGTTFELQGRYDDVVSYKGGWLGYGPGDSGPVITRFDSAGAPTDVTPGTDFAVSDDGTQLAWVEDGTLHSGLANGHGEGESTQRLPAGAGGTAVGFVRQGVVYSLDGTAPAVHVTDLAGHDTVVPGLLKSWGVSQSADLVGGETRFNPDGTSCWRVARPDGAEVWHTCVWALGGFSPDGRYVVGTPSDGDGLGSSRVALLDARTGAVAATFASPTNPQLFVRDFGWEDDGSLLACAYSGGRWTVLRLRVDGTVERALPPLAGSDVDAAYHLAPR